MLCRIASLRTILPLLLLIMSWGAEANDSGIEFPPALLAAVNKAVPNAHVPLRLQMSI